MTEQLVELIEHTANQYILLEPTHIPARSGPTFGLINPYDKFSSLLQSMRHSKFLSVDFETRGNDFSLDTFTIRAIGLAWDTGSCYFDWGNFGGMNDENVLQLTAVLESHKGLIAHNVGFDGGVYRTQLNNHPSWHMCTYSAYAMLANEGYAGRYWSLKSAMTELLLWENTNTDLLDNWLIDNGHGRRYIEKKTGRHVSSPDKAEMWRAPTEILGQYCVLDAEATYLLYTQVLRPALDRFPALDKFLQTEWMNHIILHIDQKIDGILMDRDGLLARREELNRETESLTWQFINHDETRDYINNWENNTRQELYEKQPPEYVKSGAVSKNWIKWNDRYKKALAGDLAEYNFNTQSGQQMRGLLYDYMGFPVRVRSEGGEPSVGAKAFKHMGELGSILTRRSELVKELSYIDKYLELIEKRDTIHPSFRTPGTVTGRLSSKEPNLQQLKKTHAVMSLFVAPPGRVWVDLDFSALEPVVTTEFSGDENMRNIYGDGRPVNDIYLYVGANISSMRDKILGTGYDPFNPTPEALARAKKECKHERGICKTVALACAYGAGVNKVMQTLEDQDIFLEWDEVSEIHQGYWDTFSGVKDFARSLHFEWKRNGGFIINGLGRPMAVPEEFNKDLLNRFIQSTGHDLLVKYVYILTDLLNREKLNWRPVIADFHDSTCVSVPIQDAELTVSLFNEAMDILNSEIQGSIRLRGTPTVGVNLSECKEPES